MLYSLTAANNQAYHPLIAWPGGHYPAKEGNQMAKKTQETLSPISPDLLEILRDPQALQQAGRHAADPSRLELVHGSWLVSADTGYKYPIRDGIPVMLIEEGARWKDTPVDALPCLLYTSRCV